MSKKGFRILTLARYLVVRDRLYRSCYIESEKQTVLLYTSKESAMQYFEGKLMKCSGLDVAKVFKKLNEVCSKVAY